MGKKKKRARGRHARGEGHVAEFPANVRFSARNDISFLSKDLPDHAALPSNWIGGGKRFSGAFRAGAPLCNFF